MHGPVTTEETRSPGSTRREALLGGALLATAGLAFARTPTIRRSAIGKSKLEALVPERIGDWMFEARSGLILPPPDQLQDKIYSQLVTRQYSRNGRAVMLLIAYSDRQDGAIQVHRPEVCYPASGLPILSTRPLTLDFPGRAPIPAQYLIAKNESHDEQLIYWVRIGQSFPTSWIGSHLSVMRENLAGVIPDGVLVRISVMGPDNDTSVLTGFARDLVAASGETLRRVLIG